ncbi:hypothetical protein B0H34DRAFT_799020 [Crassisporium funariophilum]|nr:hypothetical protein B0H34DRAFT_799020 [Crassisporium funariophilum]
MSPQNVADAANISPYPFAVRQERTAAPTPGESADRGRNGKGKKPKARPRVERQEEEIRFNTGPRTFRGSPAARGGARRGFGMLGRRNHPYIDDQNAVPDYPPPTFQEAMTSPAVSVCSSTVSLVPTPMHRLAIPEEIPEVPRASADVPTAESPLIETTGDNLSDCDGSIEIIDPNSVPVCSDDLPRVKKDWRNRRTILGPSDDLPSGPELEKRVKNDWRSRRGFEFPASPAAPSQKQNDVIDSNAANRGRTSTRNPGLLIIDPDITTSEDYAPISPLATSPKRRFLSLSPLKTIFHPRSVVHQDRAMSAHPSPSCSPYSGSRSVFFRSSTTLATASFLGLPLMSSSIYGTGENRSRKFFGHKGKEPVHVPAEPEKLDAWEVLDEESYSETDKEPKAHPHSLMSAVASMSQESVSNLGTSPSRSQSFTFGSQATDLSRPIQSPIASYDDINREVRFSQAASTARQHSPVRERNGPPTAFLNRSLRRGPIPPPIFPEIANRLANSVAPPVDTSSLPPRSATSSPPWARTAGLGTPSLIKHTVPVAHPSPLRLDSTVANQCAAASVHQRALDTPLPLTPILPSHFEHGSAPITSAHLVADKSDSDDVVCTCRSAPSLNISTLTSLKSVSTNSLVKAEALDEPMTPTRHHYAGRPLPRPPPTVRRTTVDSTYASPESAGHDTDKGDRSYAPCPEGLLIDLEDTTFDSLPASGTCTPRSDEGRIRSQLHLPIASSSATQLSMSPGSELSYLTDPMLSHVHLPSMSPSMSPRSGYASQVSGLSELTDLDLLVSQLADREHDGSDYEVSSGHTGWREPSLNNHPDSASGFRVDRAGKSNASARAIPSNVFYPDSQHQRQPITRWAY